MPFELLRDLDQEVSLPDQEAVALGDGVFETMLLCDGEIRLWHQHWHRLSTTATHLQLPCPEQQWLQQVLEPYRSQQRDLVIKLILLRGDTEHANCVYIVHRDMHKNYINQNVKAITSQIKLPLDSTNAGIKHFNRARYTLAARELAQHPACNECVMLNERDEVIEGLISNLFFVKDSAVYTPDLSESGVNGIMRNLVLNKLDEMGKTVKIGHFRLSQLVAADECFYCNSVRGIRPVVAIDDQAFSTGPLTSRLIHEFNGITFN